MTDSWNDPSHPGQPADRSAPETSQGEKDALPQSRSRTRASQRTTNKKRTRLIVLLSVAGVLVVALAAGGWLVTRVLNAKTALEQAEALVGTVKDQLLAGDVAALQSSSAQLSDYTTTAVEQTADPVWRVAEFVPLAGKNLSAVRLLAESIDSIAQNTVAPLSAIANTLSIDAIKPVDGRINLEPIQQLTNTLTPAAAAFEAAASDVAAIDFDGTVPQVSAAGTKLNKLFASTTPMVVDASANLALVPDMLGASGPRSYLMIFENLAETTALGGTAAALTEMVVDNGAISVGRQASSQSFGRDLNTYVLPPDPGVAAIFNDYMYATLNLATSRPDFPTAASIASAFWERDIGGAPDGVISIDPMALAHILGATGPVAMETGDVLTKENAVGLLLNEIYFRYQGPDGPDQTDAFFAEAARTIFDALTNSSADPKALFGAIMQGVDEHRIMAWSAHPSEQSVIGGSPIAGILPTDNVEATTTGVFFRDMSVSKMTYYLDTAATLTTDVCTSTTPTFTTSVDLRSNITQEQADDLPSYVASGPWKGEKFKTQVFVYGPPGTTLVDSTVTVGGDDETFVGHSGPDLGRPVATFWVMLTPGESATVTATFAGSEANYGAPVLRTTPMVNPTATTVIAEGCKP